MVGGPDQQTIKVTNDGATILKSIGVDNPASKVLVGAFSTHANACRQTLYWLYCLLEDEDVCLCCLFENRYTILRLYELTASVFRILTM